MTMTTNSRSRHGCRCDVNLENGGGGGVSEGRRVWRLPRSWMRRSRPAWLPPARTGASGPGHRRPRPAAGVDRPVGGRRSSPRCTEPTAGCRGRGVVDRKHSEPAAPRYASARSRTSGRTGTAAARNMPPVLTNRGVGSMKLEEQTRCGVGTGYPFPRGQGLERLLWGQARAYNPEKIFKNSNCEILHSAAFWTQKVTSTLTKYRGAPLGQKSLTLIHFLRRPCTFLNFIDMRRTQFTSVQFGILVSARYYSRRRSRARLVT